MVRSKADAGSILQINIWKPMYSQLHREIRTLEHCIEKLVARHNDRELAADLHKVHRVWSSCLTVIKGSIAAPVTRKGGSHPANRARVTHASSKEGVLVQGYAGAVGTPGPGPRRPPPPHFHSNGGQRQHNHRHNYPTLEKLATLATIGGMDAEGGRGVQSSSAPLFGRSGASSLACSSLSSASYAVNGRKRETDTKNGSTLSVTMRDHQKVYAFLSFPSPALSLYASHTFNSSHLHFIIPVSNKQASSTPHDRSRTRWTPTEIWCEICKNAESERGSS